MLLEIGDWARISNADRGLPLQNLRNGVLRKTTRERSEPKRHEEGGMVGVLTRRCGMYICGTVSISARQREMH